MEQENVQNVEETKETKTTENTETQTAEQKVGKTFTQAEFKDALDKEVARKTRGIPTKEELKEFNAWKESKKTEAEKQTELTQNNIDLKNQNLLLTQKLAVIDAGVNKEYRDFIQFTVSQIEGEFEDNLDAFLKENPKYLQNEKIVETPKTTGVAVQKINENADSGVNAILKAKHPELFN